jgi:glycosyltransferase involved in cell wall biosynthesis
MKVAIVAYGHSDNVICLAKHVSSLAEVKVIFITSGNRFTRSIFDWDLRQLPFGLTQDEEVVRQYIGASVDRYLNGSIGVLIARTPSRSIVKDWSRRNLTYVKEVAEFILDNSFDVVHFNGFSGFQLHFYRYLKALPKVYTVHDYVPHGGEWKITPVVLNRIYAKMNYQFIQHYRYLSKSFARFYSVDPERVHTIYCGPLEVYRSFSIKSISEEPKTILFFGRISPYKGIRYLIEAMPEIRRQLPGVKCVIAGKGNIGMAFENNGEYEIYNYHIPNDKMVDLVRRAAVIVLPYTDATHSAVLMTSYAFNKPVVASRVGGIPEVVFDDITGLLVPPGNAHAISTAIISLLHDEKKRIDMKNSIARMCTTGFLSWDHIAKDTVMVYQEAIRS